MSACPHCGKSFNVDETPWLVMGKGYCSKECAWWGYVTNESLSHRPFPAGEAPLVGNYFD